MHTRKQDVLHALHVHDTGVPIYVKLRDQLLRAIGAGRLAPGEQLPTMREVAVALRVDLNTVRRAYDELDRMGAVALRRGRGSFVASPPLAPDARTAAARADELAKHTLAAAAAAGVDPRALVHRMLKLIEGGDPQ